MDGTQWTVFQCQCVVNALPNQIFDPHGTDGVSDDDDEETDPDSIVNDDSDDDFQIEF